MPRRKTTRGSQSTSSLRSTRYLFFFSSRRRHTRLQGDWSSDVCSSDLETLTIAANQDIGESAVAREETNEGQKPAAAVRLSCSPHRPTVNSFVGPPERDRKSVV